MKKKFLSNDPRRTYKLLHASNKAKIHQLKKKQNKEIKELKDFCYKVIKNLNKRVKLLLVKLEKSDNKIALLHEKKRITCKKLYYVNKKFSMVVNKHENLSSNSLNNPEKDTDSPHTRVLSKENKDFNLSSLLHDRRIITFQNGRYSNDIREVIMELVSLNVCMNKLNDVIITVLKKLAKIDIE